MSKENSTKKRHGETIDERDLRNLRKSGYEKVRNQFSTMFVLQHIRYPGKVAQIKAKCSFQACKFIGWKPHQVRVLEVIEDDAQTVSDHNSETIDATVPQAASIM